MEGAERRQASSSSHFFFKTTSYASLQNKAYFSPTAAGSLLSGSNLIVLAIVDARNYLSY